MDIRSRPRFERFTGVDPDVLRQRLRDRIAGSAGTLAGEVLDNHAQLMISGARRHSWSPCLTMTFMPVDGAEDGEHDSGRRLRIRGLFGPHPALWTLIATLYGLSAFLVFVGLMVAWSQYIVDHSMSGLFGVAAGILLAAIVYVVSLSGQSLAHDEMLELARVLDEVTETRATAAA